MKTPYRHHHLKSIIAGLIAVTLAACGGGGGGGSAPATYTIGGTVSGLSGSVVLQNNGGDNLTVNTNGGFTFANKLDNSNTYAVTVLTQPAGQTCSVSTGAGTVSGNNVGNVAVVCSTNAYTVGGTVAGLSGTVVLQNNSGNDISVSSNGNFSFGSAVAYGSNYAVTVLTQPTGQSCSIANGSGTMFSADIGNVSISCSTNTHTVGGTVSGLNGSVVLQNNAADNYTVSVNGPFIFPTAINYGSNYAVSVLNQPLRQLCSVSASTGTIAGNVSNVGVNCLSQLGGSIQGAVPNLTPTVSTFVGTTSTFLDGTGAAARFSGPYATVSDGTNLYVTDRYNNAIRKIVIATGEVTTLAGSPAGTAGAGDGTGIAATFSLPSGIAIDSAKTNLYVADYGNNKIRKIAIATGAVSSVTGTANTAGTTGAADGAGASATFNGPAGITADGTSLYVADYGNNKIRKIAIATGAVSSVTGAANTASASGAADGAAATATFSSPSGIATDGTNLYVADYSNNKIRQIAIATGVVSSVTGAANTIGTFGAADGAAATASFSWTGGVATDGTNLYVTDVGNNKIRQIVLATGQVSSLTGAANTAIPFGGAADGAATTATFRSPAGITTDGPNLYVADIGNNKIRKIVTATGMVSSLAGESIGTDGAGAAATFTQPGGITTDGISLYVADRGNHTVRKIVIATGITTTLAGQAGVSGAMDGAGATATFLYPSDITTDGTNLYVTDTGNNKIRKIVIATGQVSSLTGTANTPDGTGAADGAAATATFSGPGGITTDGTNLYVAEINNNKIRKIAIATGAVSSLTGAANTASAPGAVDGAGATATFNQPYSITTDGVSLYVADRSNHKIRKVAIATGAVSSITGAPNTVGTAGVADGASGAATFSLPSAITTDGANLYVADTGNNKIRKIVLATGVVSSVTGVADTAGISGAADGAAATATFNGPTGITTDGVSLYVTDTGNNTIRKIR